MKMPSWWSMSRFIVHNSTTHNMTKVQGGLFSTVNQNKTVNRISLVYSVGDLDNKTTKSRVVS